MSRECYPAVMSAELRESMFSMVLADGMYWEVCPLDAEAATIVSQLGSAMNLPCVKDRAVSPAHGDPCRLFVHVAESTSVADFYVPSVSEAGEVECTLSPNRHWGGPFVNLTRLSLILAREVQARGGVLIHGALAELDGMGVILAAPGGTGKTTASNRFQAPWRSLCDDTTLVVRDKQGKYMAHPWPTWSRYLNGGPGGTWDVQRAVPLKGIFILSQALENRAEPVGPGRAVSLLIECAKQASQFMPLGLFQNEVRALYTERFNNLCALANVIPVHILHISLSGAFWDEIEHTLNASRRTDNQQTANAVESVFEPQGVC